MYSLLSNHLFYKKFIIFEVEGPKKVEKKRTKSHKLKKLKKMNKIKRMKVKKRKRKKILVKIVVSTVKGFWIIYH
jgi:hypothetical protein